MGWKSILKNKREYYPSSFLEKVQREGLEQELSKVEEEMRTMPNLRMIPQPSKEWDNIKARMIEERRGNV